MESIRILIVEDDPSMSDLLAAILKGYAIVCARSIQEARTYLKGSEVQIVLLDLRLPDGNGVELLRDIKAQGDIVEVIVITSVRDVPAVVEAMKLGAYDYINKDFEYDDVRTLVARAAEKIAKERELYYLRSEISQYTHVAFLSGKSPKMKQVEELIAKTARVSASVLITGESGTGKEIIARRIHALSPIADKPFVSLNLASLSPEQMELDLFGYEKGAFVGAHTTQHGKFELAGGGTLFLDEISELRHDLQVKLLHAIQENMITRVGGQKPMRFNVRLVSASHANLEELVKEGKFREDLYYRLNVIPIHLPPLRERREDIPDFVAFFIREYAKKFNRPTTGISPSALSILKSYGWPGNIRELANLIERLVATSDKPQLNERDIPIEYQVYQFDELKKSGEEDLIKAATDAFERNFILNVLEKEHWNQTRASERLGIHRKTLEYKIKKLNLGPIIDVRR